MEYKAIHKMNMLNFKYIAFSWGYPFGGGSSAVVPRPRL